MLSYIKNTLFSHRTVTLSQWQEKSFTFVLLTICLAGLPALIKSSTGAFNDGHWIDLGGYIASYLICIAITIAGRIPFKVRAWLAIVMFFSLGVLSLFSVGPLGSGRIWIYFSAVFATLILGINAGVVVLAAQLILLICFDFLVNVRLSAWADLFFYSPDIWKTTSVTFIFLNVVSVVAMGHLIQGLSRSFEHSREAGEQLRETTRQLTLRVQAHQKTIVSLQESEERWHFALEGAGDGVWDWHLATGQIYFSSRWKKMLGYDKNEVGTAPDEWFDRIHPEDKSHVLKRLDENLTGAVPPFQSRYRLRCKDGSYKWILDRGKVMTWDDQGRALRIIGTHADITPIKELENQRLEYESRIQQMQKLEAIGTLAGGIAHDFNNILSPMIGYAEMIKEELTDKPNLQENMDEVLQAALRAKDLVNQILTFSRQESERLQPVKVQSLLSECLKLLRASIPRTVHIESVIDKRCGMVLAEPTKLHQVVMNLATNAFHAMELIGGTLWVFFEESLVEEASCPVPELPPGRYALLAIRDTGEGMEKEILDKIFEPYFTTKPRGKGTGLGLSVVHSIVKSFNGCVTARSRKGEGSEFCIYLPVMAREPVAPTLAGKTSIPHGSEHLLLVDDDKAVAGMTLQMLERLGYRVSMTMDSGEALKIFSEGPESFDLLITDMTMPRMTGVELLARVRAIRPDLPVILCSGFSDHVDEKSARDLKFNAYLAKPFSIRKMGEVVREVLADHAVYGS